MPQPALTAGLTKQLEAYRAARAFNPEAWAANKTRLLNGYMAKCGLKVCVTSISGGVDSAVTLAICAAAAKLESSPIKACVGVCQPIHSSDWALARGREAIAKFAATEITVDQSALHTQLADLVDKAAGIAGNDFARGQLRSYMRTPVGYYVAQLYSTKGTPAIVMGTGNQDEDGYLAYFCKAGDGVVDVQLISDLHKSEVFKVGRFLGVPSSILDAAPSADLWQGQTDEEELGFTYDFVELYTGWFLKQSADAQAAFVASLDAASKEQFESWTAKAVGVHNRNKHKIAGIVNL